MTSDASQDKFAKLVAEVINRVQDKRSSSSGQSTSGNGLTIEAYPLGERRSELLRTPRGNRYEDITLENVLNDTITEEDLRISSETLEMQAEIARQAGREFFAQNLFLAAELSHIPDERVIQLYNSLRPNVSSKKELLEIARELAEHYTAHKCSAYVKEAAEVYEMRKLLREEEK